MFNICKVLRSLSPEWGVSTITKAIDLPSGDQAMGDAGELGGWLMGNVQFPEVRRRGSPPSLGTNQRCVGRGASLTRKSSLPTSKESLKRSSPIFFGASSAAAKAIISPSGRHENCWMPVADLVI